ncbi:hypothetical protein [Nonomuraea jabiensis]|uniref:Uncharacterized protein n=1 Tax=Nonomuraea jabiensis TaxID=882448 RepID=A0A7W9G306_9ACTN|nr:hypothetical protein [Nonomuraea jabiensis]MBB5776236.1 hypothetical protein [Nonomuraea jabiensis]
MRRVPYVTAYDGEDVTYQLALARSAEATDGIRLSYADPVETDWMFGVLWHRHGLSRAGNPQWKLVNTIRQRRCMWHCLCQVCGQSAKDENGRIWWVMADDPIRTPAGELSTNAPPTCRACIPEARMLCPILRKHSRVYTARDVEPYAVAGEVYQRAGNRLVAVGQATEIPLDAFARLDYTLAKQLLVTLDDLRLAAEPQTAPARGTGGVPRVGV